MSGSLFVAHGDVSQISADALVYPTDQLGQPGHLWAAFCRHVPGFKAAYAQALRYKGIPEKRRLLAGETFWVPLPLGNQHRDRAPRGVVVVGVLGRNLIRGTLNREIVIAAIKTAASRLEPAADGRRLLVAMPGLRMGAALRRRQEPEATWRARTVAAKAQAEAAREALTLRDDLDAAFVAYTPDIYHLYEKARRETAGETGRGMVVPSPLAQAIRDGECVLFIGSGLSSGAGLPGWQALVGKMAAEIGHTQEAQGSTDYFLDMAQLYRQKRGPERLAALIRKEFGGMRAKPTLAHYLLMGLGVRHVITTNYDTLLERALTALRRDPVKVVREEDVARTGETGAHFVVKFHGDAEAAESAVVLSRTDYDDFFRDRPAMASLLEGLLLNQTFLFIGYSLSDPNFQQIYGRVAQILKASKRTAYAVQFDAGVSEQTRDDWKKQQLELLDVPGQGTEQGRHFLRFLDALAAAVSNEPKLFTGARTGLRDALSALGEEVSLAASRDNLSGEEVRVLASSLTFLTRHGWRPSVQHSAWETWQQLAQQCKDDPARNRMMLREALKHTESLQDADAVRAELGSGTLS